MRSAPLTAHTEFFKGSSKTVVDIGLPVRSILFLGIVSPLLQTGYLVVGENV